MRTHYIEVQDDESNADLHATIHLSWEEHEYIQRSSAWYKMGGASRSSQGVPQGPEPHLRTRGLSQVLECVRDYNLGSSSVPQQQRLDMGP